MFVEKRTSGKNFKYYLVHSFRDNGDVIKIRRYLGQNLSKKEIDSKKRTAERYIEEQIKHYREIRDPLKTVLSDTEIKQLHNLEAKFDFKVFHLSEKQWLKFSEAFSYNTNAIEGSTLTLNEVTKFIEHGIIPEKPIRDVHEAKGVVEAIGHIRSTKIHISLSLLKKIHKIVFKETKSFAGEFRGKGVEVVIKDGFGRIVHQGAPSSEVEYLLKELISWYNKNKNEYSPVLLAAVVHNQFENIHPFQDGNGRVGRLLMNNILIKHKMPPVDIEFKNRQEYYGALRIYQNDGNIRLMVELILKEYKVLRRKFR
jgi:Fic family protein